jgi:hypothetical protein
MIFDPHIYLRNGKFRNIAMSGVSKRKSDHYTRKSNSNSTKVLKTFKQNTCILLIVRDNLIPLMYEITFLFMVLCT